VRAELEALGFHAILVDPSDATATRASLEEAARKVSAIAAIRGVPSQGGVEVWIADRVTGKTVLRQVRIEPDPLHPDVTDPESALALRVVELLRASMLETTLPARPAGEIPNTPEITEKLGVPPLAVPVPTPTPTSPPPTTLRFSLAPAVLLSPGGFGPSVSADVTVAWMPSEHVGVMAFGDFPITKRTITRAAGSADLSVVLVGAGLRALFTTRASTWTPTADLGITAVVMSSSSSSAAQGFDNRNPAAAATAAPFIRFGVAFAPTTVLRIRADVLAGVVSQGVTIQFGNQAAATWGQPFVLPSLGVDFGWF
jgi:hypothetical protein